MFSDVRFGMYNYLHSKSYSMILTSVKLDHVNYSIHLLGDRINSQNKSLLKLNYFAAENGKHLF